MITEYSYPYVGPFIMDGVCYSMYEIDSCNDTWNRNVEYKGCYTDESKVRSHLKDLEPKFLEWLDKSNISYKTRIASNSAESIWPYTLYLLIVQGSEDEAVYKLSVISGVES